MPYIRELICGEKYRVTIIRSRKSNDWHLRTLTVTLVYGGGSCVSDYGTFGGCWYDPTQRRKEPFWHLPIIYIHDVEDTPEPLKLTPSQQDRIWRKRKEKGQTCEAFGHKLYHVYHKNTRSMLDSVWATDANDAIDQVAIWCNVPRTDMVAEREPTTIEEAEQNEGRTEW